MRPANVFQNIFLLLIATAVTSPAFAQEVEYNWTNGEGNNAWYDPGNWGIDDGTTPNSVNAVVGIGAGPGNVIFSAGSATSGATVLSLNVGAGAGLEITSGFIGFAERTPARPFSLQNSGAIDVTGDTASLRLKDEAHNFSSAEIRLNNGGKIDVNNGHAMLNTSDSNTGNGTVILSSDAGEPDSEITGSGGAILTIGKQTISGTGNIGTNSLGLVFDADTIVDANVSGRTLVVDGDNSTGAFNQGLMKASGGGTLDVRDQLNNTGGLIESQTGSTVKVDGATITGGTLRNNGTFTNHNSTFEDLTLEGNYSVNNASNLKLAGTIENSGDISVINTNTLSDLQIDDAVSLTGGGTVTLGGAFEFSRITDDNGGGVLTNVDNTIRGKGTVGSGLVQINNEAGGTIDANDSTGKLTLGPVSGSAMVNRGLLTASEGGNLVFGAGEYDNVDGTIDIQDGSTVTFNSGSNITGGTVQSFGSGSFDMVSTGSLTDLTTMGTINVNNADNLKLTGTINNLGDIAVINTNTLTDIQIDTAASLTGGGTVTLGGEFAFSRITDDNGGGVLTNVDNTIRGQGQLGAGLVQIINEADGTLDGNDDTGVLTLGASSTGTSVNRGLITASNGGSLLISSGEFDNSTGLIESQSSSQVTVGGTSVVNGGLFNAADGGTINFGGSGKVVGATLQSSGTGEYKAITGTGVLENVTNESSITVTNAANLKLDGAIENSGDISVINTNTLSDLQIDDAVSLTGGGTVTLGGAFEFSRITDDNGGGVLTNVDNTIRGKGTVGSGLVQINNEAGGTIDANDSTGKLTLGPVSGSAMVNRGLLTASDGGNLVFGAGEYDNVGGTIDIQDGSTVTFNSGSNITGGTVQSFGSGSFDMVSTGSLTDLTTNGTINVNNADNLKLTGTINNLGDITVNNTNTLTDIQIDTAASLTGGGTVTLGGVFGTFSRITDDSGDGVLTNVDNTIRGQGQLGVGLVHIDNLVQGVILADQSGSSLVVNSSSATFDNFGTLAAENSSLLDVLDTTNNFGIVDVEAGSRVEFETLVNGIGGVFTGDGVIDATTEIVNNGTISPGNSPGTLTLDTDLVLGSSGTLEIELAGLSMFDELIVNGDVSLGGSLELSLLDGFAPNEIDEFDVVSASLLSGSFDNVADGERLLTVDGSGSFQVNYVGNSVRLSSFSLTAVPEPATSTVLLASCLALLSVRRRAVVGQV